MNINHYKNLFKTVTIMPKGQFSKFKGAAFSIPADTLYMPNIFPHDTGSNDLLMVNFMSHSNRVFLYRISSV